MNKKISILLGIILILGLTACGGNAKKLKEQLELGNQYLTGADYAQAITAFESALELELGNVDAYLGLIEVYMAKEEPEKVAQVYRQAKEALGDKTEKEGLLKNVQKKAAAGLKKQVQKAFDAGDFDLAENYANLLSEADEKAAEILKEQIAEEKAEVERVAQEEAAKREQDRIELEGVGLAETITLGQYEQNNIEDGAEPIEWVILKKEADRMLVISRYALDCMPYHEKRGDMTWEQSDIRSWLNDSFYNTAFDEAQKARILKTTVGNPDSNAFFQMDDTIDYYVKKNYTKEQVKAFGAKGGADTVDAIFLLSYEEVFAYLTEGKGRTCSATPYAAAQGAAMKYGDESRKGVCWLRSPGNKQNTAMYLTFAGNLDCTNVDNTGYCVRPAMWISVQ